MLGPLLFIIYINDFPKVIHHESILFADDSTIIFTGHDKLLIENDINNTLQDTINWLTLNNLKINLQKTSIMTFRNRSNKLVDLNIQFNDIKILEVETTKFLGIHIDNTINWKTHLEFVCSKISKFSFALKKLATTNNTPTVLTAYHGHVAPILNYGIIFWGNSANRDHVFKEQKKCIRAICRLKVMDSCKPFFIKHKILTLPCMYILEVVMFVRKKNYIYLIKFIA